MPRSDKQEPVVFDLVEGGGPGADAAPGAGSEDPRSGFSSRLPRLSRRTWLIVAAVVAVVAVTATAVDRVRDHHRAELMRTSSVGVASLAEPPEETWTLPFDVPAGPDSPYLDQEVLVMDGLLVMPPASTQDVLDVTGAGMFEARPGFAGIVAVDPGSGEIAWRVPVEERPVCGPTGYDASVSTDVLVCVDGPDGARQVLSVTPDGATRTRPLDLADGEQVHPGPDGIVVRTLRTGDPVGHTTCSVSRPCPPEVMAEGRALRVLAEDARTGAERWTSTVEFDQELSDSCQVWHPDDTSPSDEPAWDPDLTSVSTGTESITVGGCGLSATLSLDGVRLDLAAGVAHLSHPWVAELGSGRFAVQGDGQESVVLDADGNTLRTLDGWVQAGRRSPDAPDDLWFADSLSGNRYTAVRDDGSEAWRAPAGARLALAARDVVVMDRGNQLLGLDRATGERLWTWTNEGPSARTTFRTLTDGEVVAVHYFAYDTATGGSLVAVDLDTGAELWDVPLSGAAVAVDGHLVEFTSDGLRGLG